MVKSINLEWHAFTIASAPSEKTLTLYVKRCGDWTQQLYDLVRTGLRFEEKVSVVVSVKGPFGAPAQIAKRCRRLVMISGGIGATPFVSVCKDVIQSWMETRSADPTLNSSSKYFVRVPPKVYTASAETEKPSDVFMQDAAPPVRGEAYRPDQISFPRLVSWLFLLCKIFLLAVSVYFGSSYIDIYRSWERNGNPTGVWLPFFSLILSFPLLACYLTYIPATFKNQKSYRACVSAIFISVLTLLSMVWDCYSWQSRRPLGRLQILFQYVLIPALQVSFVIFQLFSSRSRGRSETSFGCNTVDFIWVVSTCDEDIWIRKELNLYQNSSLVRLSRFITRPVCRSEDMTAQKKRSLQSDKFSHLTRFGRPNWNQLLSNITAETPSNEKIRVIFCGPSTMGKQIRCAAKAVSLASRMRAVDWPTRRRTPWTWFNRASSLERDEICPNQGENITLDVHQEIFV